MRCGVFLGTRPDTLKQIPVIWELQKNSIPHDIIATGQHTTLLTSVLEEFSLKPDHSFEIKRSGLNDLSGILLQKLHHLFNEYKYDLVIVQGDTTTSLISALAGFYSGAKIAHIEAGLRSFDCRDPFPEEMNRKLIGQLADLHFPPGAAARDNLIKEGVSPTDIHLTGNTIIDLLRITAEEYPSKENNVLITLHRRENWGHKMECACRVIGRFAEKYPDKQFIFPVHPNPKVKETVYNILGDSPVQLIEPLSYHDFIKLLKGAYLVITDSGGVQEEAAFLGKPVAVIRETTERPEIIDSGAGILCGTNEQRMYSIIDKIFSDPAIHKQMKKYLKTYGDGYSSKEIVAKIKGYE
ncbi:UDP-N-acetylglucosamine 2-epimerase (non-hydrolyzing) [Candidatus Calescamantes bacterium]|nr:UDP-N-acetylglucosamine 2-epimerase (non-hydrolyzing) [Candidatus Calescamantes bacterium]